MTIFEAYNDTKKKLQKAGIEDYVFEAKQIIKHITGLTATQILTEYSRPLSAYQENNLVALVHQRQVRYPLQYIFGSWDFYGRSFYVGPGVLIPRADTETVVEKALEFLSDKKDCEILDLCAGSGCIGITIALEKFENRVTLLEKYDGAIAYAEKNISKNEAVNTALYKGDVLLGDLKDNKYDVIVSNPPYIANSEIKDMSPETKYEPETALMAEDDGLEFYKAIIENYSASLNSGGMMLFEVGYTQSERVADLLRCKDFHNIEITNDLNGIARAVSAIKS